MQEHSALIGIAATLTIGAVSPGPSFVMVARTAASSDRISGLSAALGMGCGGFIFAVLALAGLIGFLAAVPALYAAMKLVGGLYLAYLGINIWRNATANVVLSENIRSTATSLPEVLWSGSCHPIE